MSVERVAFECNACGDTFPKWQGKCDSCGQWNCLVEVRQAKHTQHVGHQLASTQAKPISEITSDELFYYQTGIKEFDDVLGNGIVKGSVVLLGGEPGVGKSTLALQVCQKCAFSGKKILYVTAEESELQLKLRAQRLGESVDSLWVYSQTNMIDILKECDRLKPDIILLDSIQVVYHPDISAFEGTVSQVRYCANLLINWVKGNGKSAIMIGHITKDGQIAGPKVLEHLVDVILYLEGDRQFQYRILRCHKNRYSSTDNIGLFEMKQSGLKMLSDPSRVFIEHIENPLPGSVVVPLIEGNRVLLIEVQALVLESGYGMAKRNFVGINPNRANLLIAALDKRLRLKLSAHDIFLTIIGGLSVNDPSVDLAIMTALMSSLWQIPVRKYFSVCGEVGLTGEIRPVSQIEKRLNECRKSGITTCIIPEKNSVSIFSDSCFKIIKESHITSVFDIIFNKTKDAVKK